MAYLALYRQWRPQTFGELLGQDHVGQTIKNAVANNRLTHAYLFCGSRGTGKTSAAKILAKAVNCMHPINGEPCNDCDSCRDINNGTSLDVLEIDAASNRGIDEIRELKEKIKFAASQSKYKVYIIDEVHMLTNEAFNALLKTLEEPPPHVIFVLATTEPHKVPMTILSRCQRFDFHRLSIPDIVSRMQLILQERQTEYEEQALYLISRAAEGGLRDALSILDQCLTYCSWADENATKITAEVVRSILGTVEDEMLRQLTDHIAARQQYEILKYLADISGQGKDLKVLLKSISDYWRQLLYCKFTDEPRELLINRSREEIKQLRQAADAFSAQRLLAMIDILTETERKSRYSIQPRLLLEMALLQACEVSDKSGHTTSEISDSGLSNDDLIREQRSEIRNLRQMLDQQGRRLNRLENEIKNNSRINETSEYARENSGGSGNADENKIIVSDDTAGDPAGDKRIETAADDRTALHDSDNTEKNADMSAPRTDEDSDMLLSQIKDNWQQLLDAVAKKSRFLRAYLLEGKPAAVHNLTLLVAFSRTHSFHLNNLSKQESKSLVEQILQEMFDKRLGVRFVFSDEVEKIAGKVSERKATFQETPSVKNGHEAPDKKMISVDEEQAPPADSSVDPEGQEEEKPKSAADKAYEIFGAEHVIVTDNEK